VLQRAAGHVLRRRARGRGARAVGNACPR